MSTTDQTQTEAPEEPMPFSWRITRTEDGKVTVAIGDQWPKNDGSTGPRLTEESFDAVTYRIIGQTLRKLGDTLIDQSYAAEHGDSYAAEHGDEDGWDD